MFVPDHAEADLLARLMRLSPVGARAFAGAPAPEAVSHRRLGSLVEAVRVRAAAGDPVAAAGLCVGEACDGGAMENEAAPAGLYDAARAAEAHGDDGRVATFLLAALGAEGQEGDGCLGLGALALQARRFEEAAILCERCLELQCRHPRACAILGFVRAREGRTEEAKTLLAAAARIARRDPQLRSDLDAAQRILLLLQLSS